MAAGHDPGDRARGLPRARGGRERARRHRHVAAGAVHVRRRCSHKGPQGQVDAGLGKTNSTGPVVAHRPDAVDHPHRPGASRSTVCEMVFQLTPGTEAPAEMNFHLPRPPGCCARPRTPRTTCTTSSPCAARWSATPWCGPSTSTRRSSCSAAAPTCCSPSTTGRRWGRERIVDVPRAASATSTATSTTRPCGSLNQGHTGRRDRRDARAARRAGPDAGRCRGYYGSVSHNVKAIYQRYLGWFDGNPADLHAAARRSGARPATSSPWAGRTPW